jgi:hypothetical protein
LSTKAVDIYLYAPGAASPRIHLWETVDFSTGTYQTDLKPKWWNSTSSTNLQLAIVEAGTPTFLATLPAGPIFTATYPKELLLVPTPQFPRVALKLSTIFLVIMAYPVARLLQQSLSRFSSLSVW